MDFGLVKEKRPNPREKANFLSAITFFYTFPTFFQGYRNDLEVSDLYETFSEHKSAQLGDKLETLWKIEEKYAVKHKKEPSLRRILFKLFGLEFMLCGLVYFVLEFCVRMLQPLLLGRLIAYYVPNQQEISKNEAYFYAGGVISCSLVAVFLMHPYVQGVFHIGMKMRVACCALIYRKALKLSKTSLEQTTVGQIVNLLSNDVNRLDFSVLHAHMLWIGPLETITITYLMYMEVGISSVIGVIFLLLFIPLQFFLAKRIAKLRLKTAVRTDERVRLMNEIISGIQVIKMYTWEKPFAKLVSLSRRHEIKAVRGSSYIRGIYLSFLIFTTRIALFITVVTYVLFDNQITAKKVFVLTGFYNVLRQSMTLAFPQGIAQLAEANVSIKRLNKFLLYNENEPAQEKEKNGNIIEHSFPNIENYAITIENGTARWSESSNENTFTNINIKIKKGSKVAIIGPVGSGKSSLLHAILKELPLITGNLQINGKISYSSQEPWLFTGTVRKNILFGNEMDKNHYKTVTNKCALKRDFSILPYADNTIVGERGVSLSGGQRARINLARAVYQDADIYLLDDPLSAVDTHVGKLLFEECILNYLQEKTVVLVTHQLQYLKDVDHIIILKDGIIKAEGSFDELQASGLDFAQLLKEEPPEPEHELNIRKLSKQMSIISENVEEDVTEIHQSTVEEQKSKGNISGKVYKAYVTAASNWCIIFTVILLFILTQTSASIADFFITFWVNLEENRITTNINAYKNWFRNTFNSDLNIWNLSTDTCIYIYTGIMIVMVILTMTRSVSFFTLCMKASVKLHDSMFNSIILATMHFFNTNSSGRILNRFSKDIGAIDELLPAAMMDTLQIGLMLLGIVIVVASVNPWLLIPTTFIGIIFFFLRKFYLMTSRNVKRLEGVTRSPVFAHLNASLQGLTTIRAFRAQKILEKEFDNHQDLHSSAWYLFLATSRAFGYWLDLICVFYIAFVTLSFFLIGEEKGGDVGLAITQSLGLTGMFQWGMRQSAEMENQMTSVERVLEYNSIEHEKSLETPPNKKPPKTWPEKGEIKFINLFLHYFSEDPPVLKNLNFTINPLEKVGIVGRTGAGKSSLISALFQLSETKGAILIDQIDIKELGLHDLRSKISIIPQEPVLFSGTMRNNLDPFEEFDDDILWKALEEVELKETVGDLALGLNSKVSEGGSNFSIGQRQLVCLARAIVRNNKILILDEATANVDPQTDAFIQHTIRKKFSNCTVLTIAHRLHTIMDSDKVLVMDAGKMVEFDHPHILLQNKNGVFYNMLQQTGRAMTDVLTKVAKENYEKLQTLRSQI